MKGIELPINILIIIVLAVVVLIAVIALFYPSFFSGSKAVSVEAVKSSACQVLVNLGCVPNANSITISNFDANMDAVVGDNQPNSGVYPTDCVSGGDAAHDNLASLCVCYYQISTTTVTPSTPEGANAACKRLCGC